MLELQQTISECHRCELRSGCGQVVTGTGPLPAPLMFVAEQPEKEADLLGEPLVDRAGKNFWRLLTKAGVAFGDVYVTYVIKCVGEAHREHFDACKGWLWKELRACCPRVVVPLGIVASRLLLRLPTNVRLANIAGEFRSVDYMSAMVAPWYSPQHLLNSGRTLEEETVLFLQIAKARSKHVPKTS